MLLIIREKKKKKDKKKEEQPVQLAAKDNLSEGRRRKYVGVYEE